ncbi:MAG: acyl-CoA dehydrogenase family protein [Nocardioides sp.]|nr:acyl-CoA dehydrogenase family protein [Nocardioides sp.]
MHFALTEEQSELASTVRSLLAKRADSAAVRAASASDQGYDSALWQVLCEQVGVAALAVPEEHDGAGFTLFESLVVLEELGRSLAPSPLLASLVAAEALLVDVGAVARELLPQLAAGAVATLALAPAEVRARPAAEGWVLSGTARDVLDGDRAEVLLVLATTEDGTDLFAVDPADVPATWVPTMDQSLRLADLELEGVSARLVNAHGAAVAGRAALVGATATAALQVGCAQRALDMTVAYTKEREQFGRPIGSFQALKHRMADMLALVEMARSASWAASYAVSTGSPDAERLTHVAASYCGDALDHVAGETVQMHGGIAITWEHDAQLVFKRAHALGQLFGQAHEHRAALA